VEYAEAAGFAVRYLSDVSHHDVIALLQKGEAAENRSSLFAKARPFEIDRYTHTLKQNRSRINSIARDISERAKETPVLIWGAGRIFDCLNKCDAWAPGKLYLYDKYIRAHFPVMGGITLLDERQLAALPKKTSIIVASRDYFEEIRSEAFEIGFKNVYRLGEGLNG
jgi:hypothetical protein